MRLSSKRQQETLEFMADHLEDGNDLRSTLGVLVEQYTLRGDRRLPMFRLWHQRVFAGQPFDVAIQEKFGGRELMMIAAGQVSGRLHEGMRAAAYTLEAMRRIRNAVLSALIAPSIQMLMLVAIVLGMTLHLLPMMEEMLESDRWPSYAQAFNALGHFIQNYTIAIGIGLAGFVLLNGAGLPKLRHGSLRSGLNRFWPPFRLYQVVMGTSFLISVAAQLRVGVPIGDAITNLEKRAKRNNWLSGLLAKIRERLTHGMAASDAFDVGLLDDETMINVALSSKTNSFDQAIQLLARRQIERSVVTISAIAEVIGGLIRALIVAVLIWGLASFGGVVLTLLSSQRQVMGV